MTKTSRWPRPSTALLLIVLCLTTACRRPEEERVPAQLIGTWKASDPRYQDLFFEISETAVMFSTVEGGVETYWIGKTENARQGRTSTHVLYGERPGESLVFRLYYDANDGGRLRFKNQIDTVWSKVGDDVD